MSIQTQGKRDPAKESAILRSLAVAEKLQKHTGKRVKDLKAAEQAELLEAICQQLGIADETGALTRP